MALPALVVQFAASGGGFDCIAINHCMAVNAAWVRNLEDSPKAQLRVRAAEHGFD